MNKPEDKDYTEMMHLLWNAIAEYIEEIPKEELAAEAKKAGIDIESEVSGVRDIIARRIQQQREAVRETARHEYARDLEAYEQKQLVLPVPPDEVKDFLFGVFKQNPDVANMLQFRELKDLTEEDLISLLKQLFFLGIVKKPNTEGE